jgi:hypothetical protein
MEIAQLIVLYKKNIKKYEDQYAKDLKDISDFLTATLNKKNQEEKKFLSQHSLEYDLDSDDETKSNKDVVLEKEPLSTKTAEARPVAARLSKGFGEFFSGRIDSIRRRKEAAAEDSTIAIPAKSAPSITIPRVEEGWFSYKPAVSAEKPSAVPPKEIVTTIFGAPVYKTPAPSAASDSKTKGLTSFEGGSSFASDTPAPALPLRFGTRPMREGPSVDAIATMPNTTFGSGVGQAKKRPTSVLDEDGHEATDKEGSVGEVSDDDINPRKSRVRITQASLLEEAKKGKEGKT